MSRSEVIAARTEVRPDAQQPAAGHVIFVCLVFHPDSAASSILFTDLFRALAARGTRVTVLCGFPSKDSDEEVASLPRREMYDGIEIIRCGLRLPGKRNIAARLAAYVSFLVDASVKLLKLGRTGRVVGGTDPPFTSVALWLVSMLGRFPYECILLDVYPDGLVGLGALSESSLLVKMWRALNRLSYHRAKRLTVIGRDMVTRLVERYGVARERIAYIPHWGSAEVDALDEGNRRAFLERLGLQNKFVVQYSGNMGLWHDMEPFIRAAALLQDDPRIHFLFIGKGMRRKGAQELAERLGVTNTTWLDFLPREQLRESLPSCDVALISFRRGLEGVAVPSKLYGILAAGRPVIAQVPDECEVAYTVREEGCGVVVPPGDAEGIAAAIRSLAADPEELRRMAERAQSAYRRKYTIREAVDGFSRLWELST